MMYNSPKKNTLLTIKTAARVFKRIACLLILSLLSLTALADNLIHFNIQAQRADKALIAFAKDSDQTILFSFDLTKKYQANKIKGFYPIDAALKRLLKNTGLIAVLNNTGEINITRSLTAPNTPTVKESPEVSKEIKGGNIEILSIVGSRVSDRSVEDLPVAVDILSAKHLSSTSHFELGRMIQALAPSFNFSSSAISDGSDVVRPATLRGLGQDQTLVLVNGKRRHQTSLLHINTSVGRGSTGTDMNAIPAAAIKRVEILRDGSAAQYGSDAIAGVINIVLNDDDDTGVLDLSYGQYSEGDGQSNHINLSKGFNLADQGYINSTLSYRDRGYTNRAGEHGSCLYAGCEPTGQEETYVSDNLAEAEASRDTFRIGDAESEQLSFITNAGYSFDESEVYGFFTFSQRENESAAFFREDAAAANNPMLADGQATIPGGFLPKIKTDIKDISYNFGYQTKINNDATFDVSYTFGKNSIAYCTSDTLNASYVHDLEDHGQLTPEEIRRQTPRAANAYALSLSLTALNASYQQPLEHANLTVGTELRTENYSIKAGEEYSYTDYNSDEHQHLPEDPSSGGTQGFGGIAPSSAVRGARDLMSIFIDYDNFFYDNVSTNIAARYDMYAVFGGHTSLKLASLWSLNERISLRGAINTGFRSPSMQQILFNNISTQFITNPDDPMGDQISVQVGTFNNESLIAASLGVPGLKEEKSLNISVGSVFRLDHNINLTFDFYSIKIDDRIVISNKLGRGLSPILDDELAKNNVGAAQFFLNGADTQTTGLDIVATWADTLFNGDYDITLAANFTKTEVINIFNSVGGDLGTVPPEDIFASQDISIIEEWQPESHISFIHNYKKGNWLINVSLNHYGEYTITDGGRQTYGAELLTDIKINYQVNNYLSFNLGGNNIFGTTPDKNLIGNSRSGTIYNTQGDLIVDSPGVFTYSRRSAPFGFNGAFFYFGAQLSF